MDMRAQGSKHTISATPRQLESLIRLSEAHARMRLSQHVEIRDVEEAVRLVKVATCQAATDPTSGQIDFNLITSGITSTSRVNVERLISLIKDLLVNFVFGFLFIWNLGKE